MRKQKISRSPDQKIKNNKKLKSRKLISISYPGAEKSRLWTMDEINFNRHIVRV